MKNLKEALGTVIKVSEKTSESLSDDGKIDIMEGVAIAMDSVGFIKSIKNGALIKKEYLALKPAQKAELIAWFTEEFDIANSKVEIIIEKVFVALMHLNDVFAMIAPKKKK